MAHYRLYGYRCTPRCEEIKAHRAAMEFIQWQQNSPKIEKKDSPPIPGAPEKKD